VAPSPAVPPDPQKNALRRALRARRAALDPAASAAASKALTAAILAHPAWQAARSVAVFVGVRGEPDTRPLLEAALAEGRSLWLPRVIHGPAGLSELVAVHDLSVLAPAGFGLLEPARHPDELALPSVVADSPIDLILLPGLAFARSGARLGFGAGHYDRLLAPIAHASTPMRMGIAFSTFLDPPEGPIPIADHDVLVHWVATETGVHRCHVTSTATPDLEP
jgi:5-formyltetrahydrofolate cyclo-ligase